VKRICIVTPGALGSNPRVVKEATALQAAGYSVTVISTRTMPLVDQRDDSILREVDWDTRRIDFFQHRAGRIYFKASRVLQKLASTLYRLTGRTSRRIGEWAHSAFTLPLVLAARNEPADLYIAHYVAALPAAAKAAVQHGALYAFDAEDFHPGDPPEGAEGEFERELIQAIERHYLPGCAYVTAASPGIADAYAHTYGITRPTVVLNVFPLEQAPEGPTPRGTVQPGPSVYWFSQTIGPDRGLECAVRAIAMARSRPHLYLRGTPAGGFDHSLRTLAGQLGVADRLHLLPPAEPAEMERLAATYDIGLAAETGNTPNRRIALANKIFTYLLAGIPVVMSDISAHRRFAQGRAPAVSLYKVEDPESLACAIDALLQDTTALVQAREAAYRLGQERFNWQSESHKVVNQVRAVLDQGD